MVKAFGNQLYLKEEKKLVLNRLSKFDKLYLEIGGHLLYDGHASRVLPGYDPKNKLNLIKSFGKKVGLVYCVNAMELEKNEYWGNSKVKLKDYAFKELKLLKKQFDISGVAITFFSGQKLALGFIEKLNQVTGGAADKLAQLGFQMRGFRALASLAKRKISSFLSMRTNRSCFLRQFFAHFISSTKTTLCG